MTQGQSPPHEGPAIPPRLLKVNMKAGFIMASCLKQIIIRPFSRQLLKVPGVTAWLDEASSYVLKKKKSGNSGMFLEFDTIDKGDAAYFDLKEKLQEHGVDVTHPPFPSSRHCDLRETEDVLETFLKEDAIKEDFVKRLIVLENLPAELNVDEKLCEIFSTALSTVSYEFINSSHGIAILEMPSTEEVDRLIGSESTVEVTIEDRKIYASRYSARSNQWIVAVKLNKAEQKKLRGAHGHTESMDVDSDDENMDPSIPSSNRQENAVLSDNERLEMSREMAMIKEQMVATTNLTDIFGMEKIQRHNTLIAKLHQVYKPMVSDAVRRLQYNLPLPEPWNLVPEPIKVMINKVGSSHFLRIDDLEEKYKKAKTELEESKKEFLRLANSILCVEKQLKGEEAAKWEARRPKLELEKAFESKPKAGKNDQTTDIGSQEKTYSVYDYSAALGGLGEPLGITSSHHDNSLAPDETALGVFAGNSVMQTQKGKGKMGQQGKQNKGKKKNNSPGGNVAKGYGNQINKNRTASDDYGQFGRRHEEIQSYQQQKGNVKETGFGGFKGKGRQNSGGRGQSWNEQELDDREKNLAEKPLSWESTRNKAGNKNRGGGTKGNNSKRRSLQSEAENDELDGNNWGSFVGKMFGETTGGASGAVVTAEVPVKKRKQGEAATLETAQSQLKKNTSEAKDTTPTKQHIESLMDIQVSLPTDKSQASKSWSDDFERIRQDILTGSESTNEKPAAQTKKTSWIGDKFEPVNADKFEDDGKSGIKFGWKNKDGEDEKNKGAAGESAAQTLSSKQSDTMDKDRKSSSKSKDRDRPGIQTSSDRESWRDNRRSGSRSHGQDRPDRNSGSRSHDRNRRDRGRHSDRERDAGEDWQQTGYRNEKRGIMRDYQHGRRDEMHGDWGGQQDTDAYREPAELQSGMEQQPWADAAVNDNSALAKLSAIEAVLNDKMRRLQELQSNSVPTEMPFLVNPGIGQMLPTDPLIGLPGDPQHGMF